MSKPEHVSGADVNDKKALNARGITRTPLSTEECPLHSRSTTATFHTTLRSRPIVLYMASAAPLDHHCFPATRFVARSAHILWLTLN